MAADLTRVFAGRFVALVAYAPGEAIAFATSIDSADLAALGPLAEAWHREELATPLVLTPDEFRRSVDAFPLEYSAILAQHVVIAGGDPFGSAQVDPRDVRRACEVQAKSHLIHLRQGWLDAAGHDHELAELIASSAAPLRVLLRELMRLEGGASDDDPIAWAHARAGLDPSLVGAVRGGGAAPARAAARGPRRPPLQGTAERLWAFADTWQRS